VPAQDVIKYSYESLKDDSCSGEPVTLQVCEADLQWTIKTIAEEVLILIGSYCIILSKD
jgi:hypothetical protein